MTIGGSIALIIIGAILKWGVSWKPAHVDLDVIGVILMCGGVVGLIVSIAFAMRRSRQGPGAQAYNEPPGYAESPPPPTGP